MNKHDAARRLSTISTQLQQCYENLGELNASENMARAETLKTALSTPTASVSSADRLATINSSAFTVQINKLKGAVSALEEERDHIRFCIKYNMEVDI